MVSKPAHVVVPAVALFAFAAFCWVRSAHAQSENARARWEYATVEALTEYSQGNALLSIANICYHTSDGCRWDTLRVWVDRTGRAHDGLVAATARLGERGWEAVALTSPNDSYRPSVLLKRLRIED
jgi:hypothetical protein